MAFAGYSIFPGFQTKGVVSPAVQELAVTFNAAALNALQNVNEEGSLWADSMCEVGTAPFEGVFPVDLTVLDGFEPFEGVRNYKQVQNMSIRVRSGMWQRNISWDARLANSTPEIVAYHNLNNMGQLLVSQAKKMKARLAASVLLSGLTTATVYAGTGIPGADKALFATDHLLNPLDAKYGTFSNYHNNFGGFNARALAWARYYMRTIPSPVSSAETLGLQVTDVYGGPQMEEAFRRVALADLTLQVASNTGGSGLVAAAPTNIYASGSTPWKYHICDQLKDHPGYANGGSVWWTASSLIPGLRPIAIVAPNSAATPQVTLFGEQSELAVQTRKIHLCADLDLGAAPMFPHAIQMFVSGTSASIPTTDPAS